MKKFISICLTLFPFLFFPRVIHAEEITSFEADIVIQKDGTFDVGETISYDFGNLEKHGIYRDIRYKKKNTEGNEFILELSGFSIFNERKEQYTFTVSQDGTYKKLKIGDPNTIVSGEQTYIIQYTVSGGLTYFSDHDELYWQITGTDSVPIKKAEAVITLPEEIDPSDVKTACFTGSETSNDSTCSISYGNGRVTVSSERMLTPGEGLTVVVGFPKNIVAILEPKAVTTWLSTFMGKLFVVSLIFCLVVWYVVLPIFIIVNWFRKGRDPQPPMGVAKAWFDVPKTDITHRPLTPGETGTLIDERADMREITATIVDLARRGYMKILEKKKGDFYLEKRNAFEKEDSLQSFEKTLYDGIFSGKSSVRIKDADFIDIVAHTKKQLYEAVVREKFFVSNPESTRMKYSIIGIFAIFTMNFPLALSAFLFGRAMPKKTILGAQNAAIAKSLKNFITSQERQYTYQAKNQIFFERFLPFAIALGVEKIWADRFKDVKLTKPDWYDGYNMRAFNTVYFVHSINSSMQTFSSAATPTHSSSGFSSGFSGGSVGGGGGGGGCGSW